MKKTIEAKTGGTHTHVRVSLRYYALDSWEPSDGAFVTVDGAVKWFVADVRQGPSWATTFQNGFMNLFDTEVTNVDRMPLQWRATREAKNTLTAALREELAYRNFENDGMNFLASGEK